MGCGICKLDIMACRCPMWDVGYTLQICRRWGLGGTQVAFNGISSLASCHHVLLMFKKTSFLVKKTKKKPKKTTLGVQVSGGVRVSVFGCPGHPFVSS